LNLGTLKNITPAIKKRPSELKRWNGKKVGGASGQAAKLGVTSGARKKGFGKSLARKRFFAGTAIRYLCKEPGLKRGGSGEIGVTNGKVFFYCPDFKHTEAYTEPKSSNELWGAKKASIFC